MKTKRIRECLFAFNSRYVPLAAVTLVTLSLPAVLLAAASSQPAERDLPFINPRISADPPQGLLVDAWYRLQLGDQPMGYMRTAMQRKGDRIESLDYTQIRISRGPITIKVIVKTVAIETVDGRPVEMHTEQVMGSQPMRYDAVFHDDKTIDLRITQSGNTIDRRIPADPDTTLPWGKTLGILHGQPRPGESFVERTYSFVSDTKPVEVDNQYKGKTELHLADRPNGSGPSLCR